MASVAECLQRADEADEKIARCLGLVDFACIGQKHVAGSGGACVTAGGGESCVLALSSATAAARHVQRLTCSSVRVCNAGYMRPWKKSHR